LCHKHAVIFVSCSQEVYIYIEALSILSVFPKADYLNTYLDYLYVHKYINIDGAWPRSGMKDDKYCYYMTVLSILPKHVHHYYSI
jgi:hypothetical protein